MARGGAWGGIFWGKGGVGVGSDSFGRREIFGLLNFCCTRGGGKRRFFKGGRSRLPPRSVLDGAHRAPGPPLHPHGEGNERESFTFGYSELLRATPPVAERRQPPQRGGQPPSLREVPPKAAEGVIKGADSFVGGGGTGGGGRGIFPRGSHPRLACRLGRFAAERHWRSLTPLPLL